MPENTIETKNCKHCNISFDITDKDLEFYEKVSLIFEGVKYKIPTPSLCPACRHQRRLSFRNERKLYKRLCDATGKQIISIYSPDKTYKVYNQEFWLSDKWNALDYGIDFDFSRGFFEQFNELFKSVPKQSIIGSNNYNSDYCNLSADNKDCYLISESSNNEQCYYGYWLQKCVNCIDSGFVHECRYLYESDNCNNCYNSSYLFNCVNCSESSYLEDCIGCNYCYCCVNLVGKKYHIFNEEYSKEDYEKEIAKLKKIQNIKEKFLEFKKTFPKKYARIFNSPNCSGDYIENSKNCYKCFDAYDAEDCRYGHHVWRNAKDCMDVSTAGRDAEKIYEAINCGISDYGINFSVQCWDGCNNLNYCINSYSISNCFGCVGLRNKSYCILNKQYTKEEYEKLVPKIIEHMMLPHPNPLLGEERGQATIEWGEFFPSNISPFGYNETVAMEYFPITKEEVIKKGFNWSDYETPLPNVEKIIKADHLPENIADIPDDILNWAIECEITKKPFRIIKPELDFYRNHNLPIPKRHPDQRHLDRMQMRNTEKLYDRKCDKCGIYIKTSYSPERPEKVYCEDCYNKEVY
ncbi:MAG: hypothetical protein PHS49_02355 [Candidatus Gracilibacteria bacterium]|nr:hypothetical protein [Candidatus Gracilibacteria bacterium]